MSALNSTKAAFPGRREVVYARVAGAMYVLGDGRVDLGGMITSRIAGDSSFVDNAHRIAAAEGMYRFATAMHAAQLFSLLFRELRLLPSKLVLSAGDRHAFARAHPNQVRLELGEGRPNSRRCTRTMH